MVTNGVELELANEYQCDMERETITVVVYTSHRQFLNDVLDKKLNIQSSYDEEKTTVINIRLTNLVKEITKFHEKLYEMFGVKYDKDDHKSRMETRESMWFSLDVNVRDDYIVYSDKQLQNRFYVVMEYIELTAIVNLGVN
jgi:hypothetical protein